MKKWYFILILLSVFIIFTGCNSDEVPADDVIPETVPPVVEPEEIIPEPVVEAEPVVEPEPEPEIEVEPEPEIEIVVEPEIVIEEEPVEEETVEEEIIVEEEPVIFTTDWIDYVADDKENCGYFVTTDELGTFSSIEGEFRKDSGNEGSYFGFVFGYSSQEDGIVPDFFRFGINVKGEFSVHTWDGTRFFDLLDPEADTAYLYRSSAINTGYGEVNKLSVTVTDEGTISCFINDVEVASGIEPFEKSTYGTMVFFSVGTEAEENLPEVPVAVSFRITDSVSVQ